MHNFHIDIKYYIRDANEGEKNAQNNGTLGNGFNVSSVYESRLSCRGMLFFFVGRQNERGD